MAKPNYNQQKKQRELARQARQNEKLKKRQARVAETTTTDAGTAVPTDTGSGPDGR
ncbi:MAG: hypothetical protein ABIX37_01995 [Gammaproteobacteria bacterium]